MRLKILCLFAGLFAPVLFVAQAAPSNDAPCGAVEVSPGGCFDGDNTNANDMTNGQGVGADCQSHGNNIDVWFTFVADSTGFNFQVYHDTTISGITYTASSVDLILYRVSSFATGPDTCNINYLIGRACWEDDGTRVLEGSTAGILVPGERYYFLVSSAVVGGENPGTFRVCFDNIPSLPPASSCDDAQTLCEAQSFHESDLGFVPSQNITTNSCFAITKNQVKWYQLTFATSGTFGFNIVPDVLVSDYDFMIWNSSNSPCDAIMPTPDACNWSGCVGATGIDNLSNICNGNPSVYYNAFGDAGASPVPIGPGLLNVNAGETWTILIDNFSSGSGYTFNFSDDMTALVGPQPDILFDSVDCGGSGLHIRASAAIVTPGFHYVWELDDGAFFDGSTSISHTFADFDAHILRLTVIDTLSTTTCLASAEVIGSCALPIAFEAFYGVEDHKGVRLHWKVNSRINPDQLWVQKQDSTGLFRTIANLGYVDGLQEFWDTDVREGTQVYRIGARTEQGQTFWSENEILICKAKKARKLVAIYDLQGRKLDKPLTRQLNFFLFDDGSVEKKWIQ